MKFEYSYLNTFSLLQPEAHWARIRDFHSSLFLAFFSTSPQLNKIHVWGFLRQFTSILFLVGLSSSSHFGVHFCATILVTSFVGCLRTWSIHLYLYFLSNVLISIFLVISWIFIPVIIAFSWSGDWEIGAEDDWSWQRGNRTSMSE